MHPMSYTNDIVIICIPFFVSVLLFKIMNLYVTLELRIPFPTRCFNQFYSLQVQGKKAMLRMGCCNGFQQKGGGTARSRVGLVCAPLQLRVLIIRKKNYQLLASKQRASAKFKNRINLVARQIWNWQTFFGGGGDKPLLHIRGYHGNHCSTLYLNMRTSTPFSTSKKDDNWKRWGPGLPHNLYCHRH